MAKTPNSKVGTIILIFFIAAGIASFTKSNTSIWFKVLMGIAIVLSVYALSEKIYLHFKNK
ncbi:hypothetical protein [Fructilactobacillus frigidiflavus]|uniref:hypothetical protein n=1 Tax=Fructilactobacillus frigidiflavus TaxID=3242688 RepID=UPI00375823E4